MGTNLDKYIQLHLEDPEKGVGAITGLDSEGVLRPISSRRAVKQADFDVREIQKCGKTFQDRDLLFMNETNPITTVHDFLFSSSPIGSTQRGIEIVFAMMRDLFVGLVQIHGAGIPIRFIDAAGIVYENDSFKFVDLGYAGQDKYMQALTAESVDIMENDLPPEVVEWRALRPDERPTRVAFDVMAKGDVFALGRLVGFFIDRLDSVFTKRRANITLDKIKLLQENMVMPLPDDRPSAIECLRRFDEIMAVLPSDMAWRKRGEGGYACVGVQDADYATKLYHDDIDASDYMDEIRMAKLQEAMDPMHVFTLKTSARPMILRRSRFPGSSQCLKSQKMGQYVFGLRMQAAKWALNNINSVGAVDVPDLDTFIRVQQSLFDGLVVFREQKFVHHDIKPQNIVFDESSRTLKYIDFGISGTDCYKAMQKDGEVYRYFAPEYLADTSPYNNPDKFKKVAETLFNPAQGAGVSKSADDQHPLMNAWDVARMFNMACVAEGLREWVRLPRVERGLVDFGRVQVPVPGSVHLMPFFDYVVRGRNRFALKQPGAGVGAMVGGMVARARDLFTGIMKVEVEEEYLMSQSDVFALGYSMMEVLLTTPALNTPSHPKFRRLLALYRDMLELDVALRVRAEDARAAIHAIETA